MKIIASNIKLYYKYDLVSRRTYYLLGEEKLNNHFSGFLFKVKYDSGRVSYNTIIDSNFQNYQLYKGQGVEFKLSNSYISKDNIIVINHSKYIVDLKERIIREGTYLQKIQSNISDRSSIILKNN
jgi:hypothetical protein